MEKKNILFLILILLVAIALRAWHLDVAVVNIPNFSLIVPTDFFKIFFTNAFAPLHFLYLKSFVLLHGDIILPYSSLLCDALAIILLYFIGAEYENKKNKELSGLFAAGFGAVSVFLIHFAKIASAFSLVFLLSTFVLFFSLKFLNTQNKKYFWELGIFSLLLFLTFNLSLFFIIFNFIALFIFSFKKKRSVTVHILSFLGLLALLLPVIPFVLNVINIPDYLTKYSLSFEPLNVVVYFTNMFSPQLSFEKTFDFKNIGFWIFVILPSFMGFFLVVKGVLGKKAENFYFIILFLSTFLSMLIICLCAKEEFLSVYLITLYPVLITSATTGLLSLKSKPFKIILPTLFVTITLFYIVARNLLSTNLF